MSDCCFQCATPQEVLEEHLQPVGRREDAELSRPGVCAPSLQTHPPVCHGRDRCRLRLQKRFYCCQLYQGKYDVCKLLCYPYQARYCYISTQFSKFLENSDDFCL